MSNDVLTFKKGKVSRNELELPTLHFIAMDQWVDVIGEKALFAWLKMYTWCKRDDETEKNQWEEARIPTSFNQIIKKLGVGRGTFYKHILRPLWNVGLIDIEEYNLSENKGSKPMNIVVYKYPQNNKSLAHEPIKEVRNYDNDYVSKERTFAKKGGRRKVVDGGCTQPVQRGVPDENSGVYPTSTGGCTEIVPNNIINNINKNFNNNNNSFNSSNLFNTGETQQKNDAGVSTKPTTKTHVENDVAEIIQFWDNNGFGHSQHSKDMLLGYLEDGDFDEPKEMIIRALQLACENNKRTFAYVRTILHNWINENIRNLSDVDMRERNRKNGNKSDGSASYGSLPKTEMTDGERDYWAKKNEEFNASLPDFIT